LAAWPDDQAPRVEPASAAPSGVAADGLELLPEPVIEIEADSEKKEASPPPFDDVYAKARRTGASWDFQFEVGGTLWAAHWHNYTVKNPDFPIFLRGRAGLLVLREPWYLGIGPTIAYGGVGTFAFGAQAELTNIWGGVWAQAEAAWHVERGLLASFGAGYQLFGGEVRLSDGGRDVAVIFKFRAPVGLVLFVKGFLDQKGKSLF
jgi:hypothetical protein